MYKQLEVKSVMLVVFHTIFYIYKELSTPVWQNEVRRITQQVVEAMSEVEKNKTSYDRVDI